MRPSAIPILGLLAVLLALVPLAGWGAGFAPLAGYFGGWPIVSPISAAALAIAGIAVAVQGSGSWRGARQLTAGVAGVLLLLTVVWGLLRHLAGVPMTDPALLVERWIADPAMLLQRVPSPFTLGAIGFLGAALLLVAAGSSGSARGAWITAAAAAVVALLTAGPPTEVVAAPAAAETLEPVSPMSPPVAFIVLLLSSALLLVRSPQGEWWVPGGRIPEALVRLLLPAALPVIPALVWLEELLERRQVVPVEAGRALLAAGLLASIALLVAYAVWRLGLAESSARQREQRRVQRQLELESELAAQRADRSLRVAADRYRAHVRRILDVAPAPFVAVDRDGAVAYLNPAAAELFGCAPAFAAGRPLWDAWPELGPELRGALGSVVTGAVIRQTLVSGRTGRAVELRGYPDEAGAALFLRVLP